MIKFGSMKFPKHCYYHTISEKPAETQRFILSSVNICLGVSSTKYKNKISSKCFFLPDNLML